MNDRNLGCEQKLSLDYFLPFSILLNKNIDTRVIIQDLGYMLDSRHVIMEVVL